jgi:acetyl-CoA acetyltransferase
MPSTSASAALRGAAAISGLGVTPMGKVYGHDATHFAGEAIRLAVEDAGLTKDDIDGLLISAGIGTHGALSLGPAPYLGFEKLRVLNHMNGAGSTAAQMVLYAPMCIQQGMANHVGHARRAAATTQVEEEVMKGIQYLVDEAGNKTSVLIDLREWGSLWEDIYDVLVATARRQEPTEEWLDLDDAEADDIAGPDGRVTSGG